MDPRVKNFVKNYFNVRYKDSSKKFGGVLVAELNYLDAKKYYDTHGDFEDYDFDGMDFCDTLLQILRIIPNESIYLDKLRPKVRPILNSASCEHAHWMSEMKKYGLVIEPQRERIERTTFGSTLIEYLDRVNE